MPGCLIKLTSLLTISLGIFILNIRIDMSKYFFWKRLVRFWLVYQMIRWVSYFFLDAGKKVCFISGRLGNAAEASPFHVLHVLITHVTLFCVKLVNGFLAVIPWRSNWWKGNRNQILAIHPSAIPTSWREIQVIRQLVRHSRVAGVV